MLLKGIDSPPRHTIRQVGRPYVPLIVSLAARYGIPEVLISHQMYVESTFRPGVVSPAGAVGIMQLMPATAAMVAARNNLPAEPLTDATVNATLGVAHMRELFNEAFARIGDKQRAYEMALIGYFGGPGRMRAVINGAAPTAKEVDYVKKVIEDFNIDQTWGELVIEAPKPTGIAGFSFMTLLFIGGVGYYVWKKRKK